MPTDLEAWPVSSSSISRDDESKTVNSVTSYTKKFVEAATKAIASSNYFGHSILPPSSYVSVSAESVKSLEVRRQIARLQEVISRNKDDSDLEKLRLNVADTVKVLQSLLISPLPIPIASSGDDLGTTLFLKDDKTYLDIEIADSRIHYYLKDLLSDDATGVSDTEELEDGRVPPKLLGLLFMKYVANNAFVS